MIRRKFISFTYLPSNTEADPREYGIWSILAGLCVLVLVMLAGWHFAAPHANALVERERENNRLREQLRALHALDGTLESQISTLSERAASISRIVQGPDAPGPVAGAGDIASSEVSFESTASPEALLRRLDGRLDRLLTEARSELVSLQSIEAASRKDETYWHSIPIVSPVRGPVSRSFGSSRNLLSDEQTVHGGLDIAANRDDPVRATAFGVVSRIGMDPHLGRYVDLTHGDGYVTRYGHLAEVLVERGKQVARGEVIGLVGMTGKTSGYHIHYEIYHNGRILDPSMWFFPDRDL